MANIAFIPARCGSKSIKFKNLAKVNGVSLVHRAIKVAKEAKVFEHIIVSTDCEKIAQHALEIKGVEIHYRNKKLATDSSLVGDAILDYLEKESNMNVKYISLIEPTAPLRISEDLQKSLALCIDEGLDSVATFTEADVNPYRTWSIDGIEPKTFIENINPWLPRQALPAAFQLNGIVYVVKVDSFIQHIKDSDNKSILFGKIGSIIIPKERSIDIDSELELKLAELILNEKENVNHRNN